ncbi:response regulator [Limnohabitans sp.]|uniref:response regulator n=1 Tax=Limnohabitans sp. TaxID=1907725 RepID=UPI0038BB491F
MNVARKILIVEDDPALQELLRLNLSRAGYEPLMALGRDMAMTLLAQWRPQLVLLDWNLPDHSGLDLVKRIRKLYGNDVYLIMLTARDDEHAKIQAFDAGVDDYLTKPFRVRELLARINGKMRRLEMDQSQSRLEVNGVIMDLATGLTAIGGERMDLSVPEHMLLRTLMSKPMQVFSRAVLLELIYADDDEATDKQIDELVSRLRLKMDRLGHPRCIETIRSVGFRMLDGQEQPKAKTKAAQA